MGNDTAKVILAAALHPQDGPANLPIILDQLKPEDFPLERDRAIFLALQSLDQKRIPVDPITLLQELEAQGQKVLASEILKIDELVGHWCRGFSLDYHIDQLKACTKRRKLTEHLYSALKETEDPSLEYRELEEKVIQGIMAILDEGRERETKTPDRLFRSVLDLYYTRKAQRKEGKTIFGVPTAFRSLDGVLGGLQEGTLGILAARQHHGKSTVAMDIFFHAGKNGVPSLYMSLEQPSEETLLFLVQKEMGLKPLDIKTGNLPPDEERWLTSKIYEKFKLLPLFFEDQTRTLAEVSVKIRRMTLCHKIKLAVIDYLQLVENPLKGEPRHIEVAGISRTLKRLAMELKIAILALSQLNKSPEERTTKEIHLSDMRESEAISQDADYVLFLHRPRLMGRDDQDHLELAKNRHGETISRINVQWDRCCNSYSEMKKHEEPGSQ